MPSPLSDLSDQSLHSLRELIAQVERRPMPKLSRPVAAEQQYSRQVPLEVADVDAALQGGLHYDVLQEVFPARTEWDDGLTTAFSASLLVRRQQEDQRAHPGRNQKSPLFWIAQHDTAGSGLSAQGLVSLGLDPQALWLVRVRNDKEALWAFEEVLDHSDALGVVCELCQLDLAQSHRLNLKAAETAREDRGRLLLALRRHKGARRPQANPTAAATRWRLAAIPPHLLAPNGQGKGRTGAQELRRPAQDAAALSLGPQDAGAVTHPSLHEASAAFTTDQPVATDPLNNPPNSPSSPREAVKPPAAHHPMRRVRWRAELFRQRGGAPASWLLEWSYETHRFRRLSELCTVGATTPR
ncbi:MAG: hypothetical protein CBC49_010370 [Alphaproteobacteria bacterium TMED89]|nr:hypothetical protein [Rhodospirillaceae bacterium]RPH10561.1 MAG: hypothetical protein CBC49_010370 [Alphaproteobacteria bacterium TMED89]